MVLNLSGLTLKKRGTTEQKIWEVLEPNTRINLPKRSENDCTRYLNQPQHAVCTRANLGEIFMSGGVIYDFTVLDFVWLFGQKYWILLNIAAAKGLIEILKYNSEVICIERWWYIKERPEIFWKPPMEEKQLRHVETRNL